MNKRTWVRNILLPARIPAACHALVLIAVAAGPAAAEDSVEAIVKMRIASMETMDKAVKNISSSFDPVFPYEPQEVMAEAKKIQAEAKRIPELFPEGSMTSKSEALADIWSRKGAKKFTKNAKSLVKRVNNLVSAANRDDRDAVADEIRRINRICEGCHAKFRKN